ncbi:MAG TPA: histidine kinase [Steroidobacteraceae bacterium]|nr:histidine kinase [Steroidobacteraceae bacterium]
MNATTSLPLCTVPASHESRPREQLLAAAAQSSRLLLESSDAMGTMPEVLRLLGEAAGVDRTTLALADIGSAGERWLVIKSEWTAPGIPATEHDTNTSAWNPRRTDCYCSELSEGRSVFLFPGSLTLDSSIASDTAKSSVIVPFLFDGEYAGAVGFDSLVAERPFDSAVISALEIAASVVGAALQRDRLVTTMRREREAASEQRVAELARANAALRANLERLASQPAEFFDALMLETTRQVGAACGTAVVQSYATEEWQIGSFVHDGNIAQAPFADSLPRPESSFMQFLASLREPVQVQTTDTEARDCWPEFLDYHRNQGHDSLYLLPLVFGDRNLGFLALGFQVHDPLSSESVELLIALSQQLTLALAMKRFAHSGKQAAVLAERNRIGREIHDGLAQAFTGILMQLGAAEEIVEGSPLAAVLIHIRDIARDGLTEARRSVLALRPDEPRTGGLELALRQLAERSTVAGRVASTFQGGGTATGLPPEHEHALLRIAQEAVINAVRHAQPANIEILLSGDDADLLLCIRDDGVGMEQMPELYAQQGFGLTNMRERAEAIGGRWQIDSAPGAGTRVSVRIPRERR